MLKELETIESKTEYSNPYWEYKIDKYKLPSGGTGTYHYVNSRGSTFIIPKISAEIYILARQYRYLNKRTSIEFPGGGLNPDTEPEINAAHELLEETGYEAGKLTFVGEYNPYNGVSNEMCRVYLAEDLVFRGANPEATEEFEIIEMTENEIINKIYEGEIWDGMTLAAWSLYYFSKLRTK